MSTTSLFHILKNKVYKDKHKPFLEYRCELWVPCEKQKNRFSQQKQSIYKNERSHQEG